MSRKPDRVISKALGGGESVSRLKKAVKRVIKKEDDLIEKMLNDITSIQACKDAALTGDEDLRLLAICRLGEYGLDAFESLDIAMNDENPLVRATAAGMLAFTKRNEAIPILEQHKVDNDQSVKEIVEFSLEWLMKYGRAITKGKLLPKTRENPIELLLEADTIPLRTTDDVIVLNDYTITPDTLEYGITIRNEGNAVVNEVTVKILDYPKESLIPLDSLSQTIESIETGDSASLIFGFEIQGECIEGEIITSVHLVDAEGEDLAAKAGNLLVRSLYEQFRPRVLTADDFLRLKPHMKQWNREHTILSEAIELFESILLILESKNFYIFQKDILEREGAFMGVQAGMAEGKFGGTLIAVNVTVVGTKGDNLSKIRIDIFADNPEFLQTAASDLFETIQIDLGILNEK